MKTGVQCEQCCHYNLKENKCTRIGQCGDTKGKQSVCWMEKSEGEY